jgi:uncharacterized protein
VLIVDTGVLLATADKADPDHVASRALLETDIGPLVTSALVIAEAAYMITRQLGPQGEFALYDSILDGTLMVEDLVPLDWQRIRVLVERYKDLPLGGTDASLVALAERFNVTRVATLDHRHFSVVRPEHCAAFELLP